MYSTDTGQTTETSRVLEPRLSCVVACVMRGQQAARTTIEYIYVRCEGVAAPRHPCRLCVVRRPKCRTFSASSHTVTGIPGWGSGPRDPAHAREESGETHAGAHCEPNRVTTHPNHHTVRGFLSEAHTHAMGIIYYRAASRWV